MKLRNLVLGLGVMALASACAAPSEEATDEGTSMSQELDSAAPWKKLGERRVDGRLDVDTVSVGMDDGRFSAIQLRVTGSSLVMHRVRVIFGNGDVFEPEVPLVFDANTLSRVIQLPGNTRFIRRVELKYGNLEAGRRAHVEVYGRNATPPPAWQELGELSVDGRHDRDTLVVGRSKGLFTAVQIRVERSALVMEQIRITFGNGEVYEPKVRLVFDAGTTSRVIDLPGARRVIKRVDFKYSDLPNGGAAKVQLWAVGGPNPEGDDAPTIPSPSPSQGTPNTTPGNSVTLLNNIPLNGFEYQVAKIVVPEGRRLTVTTEGSGEVDLMVRWNQEPTFSSGADCTSDDTGSREFCVLRAPFTQTAYVRVNAWHASRVTVKARID